MRTVFHKLAMIVLGPYLLLAASFLLLGHAVNGGSLLAFFGKLISEAVWISQPMSLALFTAYLYYLIV